MAQRRRSFAFRLTVLALLGLLVAMGCQRVPPRWFWPALLVAASTPAWLLLLALLAGFWALRPRVRRVALLPLGALALAWPQVERGLPLHLLRARPLKVAGAEARVSSALLNLTGSARLPDAKARNPQPTARNPQLRLLSANVRIFNVYEHLRQANPQAPAAFTRWLAESPADVLCLQEFYHEPRGSRLDGNLFRVVPRLGPGAGRPGVFVSKTLTNGIGAEFGLAIFSRFPIVRRGTVWFGKLSQNHAQWADLAGPRPGDTVRVFNVHLQSMSLDENDIVAAGSSRQGFRQKAGSLLRRFGRGARARSWQTDTLVARLGRSPYPVLLAGDLNDLPYSYAYARLADDGRQNAWAAAGFGFGNTYHGRLPPVLRIDQQFASRQWEVVDCRVHSEIPHSDHFPVEALYELPKSSQ